MVLPTESNLLFLIWGEKRFFVLQEEVGCINFFTNRVLFFLYKISQYTLHNEGLLRLRSLFLGVPKLTGKAGLIRPIGKQYQLLFSKYV